MGMRLRRYLRADSPCNHKRYGAILLLSGDSSTILACADFLFCLFLLATLRLFWHVLPCFSDYYSCAWGWAPHIPPAAI
jgi:hypothetical protein